MGLLKVALLAVGYQLTVTAVEKVRVAQEARAARSYADQVGRPLLVVGGPYGYRGTGPLHIPLHECGDVCADIDQAPCAGCNWIEADIRNLPFPDHYFGAALASHVLEHMETEEDAIRAWQELHRVSDRVWSPTPSKLNPWAWMNPRHHLWVHADGDILAVQRMAGAGP